MAAWTQHEDAEDGEMCIRILQPHIDKKFSYMRCRCVEEVVVQTGCPFAHSVLRGHN